MPILTPEERVGTTLAGKYRLDRILATGGMATVFAGVHAWTERGVAVKILNYEHARDAEVVGRFLQEARAAAQLKHPNVVDVLDMGQDADGTVFLVLELLEGETLKALLKRGPIAVEQIGPLLGPVLRAVASAHAKGVIHRDLKPDNIFLADSVALDGHPALIPKLLDFGIAKVADGDASTTRAGTMVGTPQYMSPEQVRGERELGPAADVWSMGVLLFYALTKQMPFNAESAAAVLARVLTERARPVRSAGPWIPDALAAVIDRALEPDAARRFAHMGEMSVAFDAALGLAPAPRDASRLLSVSLPPITTSPSSPSIASSPVSATGPLLSEHPPPITPYAWGAAPPAQESPPRRGSTLLAAGAALLVLAGIGVTVGLSLSAPEPTTAAGRPALTLPSVATSPAPTPVPLPADPLPADPAPAVPVPVDTAPAVVTTDVAPAPTAPEVASTPTEVAPTEIAPTPTAEIAAPQTGVARVRDDGRGDEDEAQGRTPRAATTERRAPARTDTTTDDAEPTTRAGRRGPQRGTGGALILRDGEDGASGAAPRRGTGGALILH